MSERKTLYQDPAAGAPAMEQSIQQTVPAAAKSAARGDARSTPVLYVESLSLDDLLERSGLDLEAEFWPSASAYADRALALDPSCARAYAYRLLADLKASDTEQLKKQKRPFAGHPDYAKVMELGDEDLKKRLQDANRYICDHLGELYRDELDRVRHALEYARVVSDVGEAETLLEHIPSFPVSDGLREQCAAKKRELFAATFEQAERCAGEEKWAEAISLLESISDSEKSRVRLLEYRQKQETENKYREGVAHQEANRFREAADLFAELKNYKDSQLRLKKCSKMIRGDKVRAVGREHTKAAWVNVALSAFMALGCLVSAPSHLLISLLWGIPLIIFSVVMTIVRARFRPARRMWIVMAAVFALFLALTLAGVLTFSPGATALQSVIFLVLTLCSIFV